MLKSKQNRHQGWTILSYSMQDVKIEKRRCCRKTRKLELWVRQKRDEACCYHCGGPPVGAFHHVKIYFFRLQAACDMCQKVRLAYAPYIHPEFKNMTTAFAEVAGQMMEEMTCEAVRTRSIKNKSGRRSLSPILFATITRKS